MHQTSTTKANMHQPVSAARVIITAMIALAVVIPILATAINYEPVFSRKTCVSAPQAGVPADIVGSYSGKYVVDDNEPTDWVGKATIEITDDGKVSGYVWLPTNDGGPGVISMLDGQVESSGRVTIRSDAIGAGGPDGVPRGELIKRFLFIHEGKVIRQSGTASITTHSTATASRCNERMSVCRTM